MGLLCNKADDLIMRFKIKTSCLYIKQNANKRDKGQTMNVL